MKGKDRIKPGLLESDDMVDEYFTCECSNPNHAIMISYDPDIFVYCNGKERPLRDRHPELVVNVQLSPYLGFWKRVIEAFKYVFKIKSDRVHWDCCSIREEDVERFKSIIHRYEIDLKKIKEAQEKNNG